jgi:hypothetical protein
MLESCQFALHRARAPRSQGYQFGRVKASIRLTEEKTQHALLRGGE